MAYKALYRSYRPQTFGEVIGQKHVIQTLKNAINEKKTSHAYVFSGLRGIGKTTIARILAKAVNCENPINGEPCNNCASCKSIITSTTTDIIELDAASNNGVDEIRNILDKVTFLPTSLNKKVYIIDEVHMLSTSAFNALLKTLEEPPAYVMFILCTTEPHKIPATILSRCQRFDFKQLTINELVTELSYVCNQENISISNDALNGIAEAAEGGMRDALSILDQASVYADGEINIEDINSVTGNVSNRKLLELLDSFNKNDATASINIVNELLDMGKEVSRLVVNVIQFCRDILLYKNVGELAGDKYIYTTQEFKDLASQIEDKKLFNYIDVLVDVQNKIRFTNSQKIYLEVGIMKIVNSTASDSDIIGRIEALEEAVSSGDGFGSSIGPSVSPALLQQMTSLDNKIKKLTAEWEKMNVTAFEEKVNSKIGLLEDVVSKTSVLPESLEERIQILENRTLDIENSIEEPLEEVQNTKQETSSINNININTEELNVLKQDIEKLKEKIDTLDSINTSNVSTSNDDVLIEIIDKLTQLEDSFNLMKATESKPSTLSYDDDRIDSVEDKVGTLSNAVVELRSQVALLNNGFRQPTLEETSEENEFNVDNVLLNDLEEKVASITNDVEVLKEMLNNLPENSILENSYNNEKEEIDLSWVEEEFDCIKADINLLQTKLTNNNYKEETYPTSINSANINSESEILQDKRIESLEKLVDELKTNYFILAKAVESFIKTKDTATPNESIDLSWIESSLSNLDSIVEELQRNSELTNNQINSLIEKVNKLNLDITLTAEQVVKTEVEETTNPLKKRVGPFAEPSVQEQKIIDEAIEELDEEVIDSNNDEVVEEVETEEPVKEEVKKQVEVEKNNQQYSLFDFAEENESDEIEAPSISIEENEPIAEAMAEEEVAETEEIVDSKEEVISIEEKEDINEEQSFIEEVKEDANVTTVEETEEDLTAKIYDVKILENILHETRYPECKAKIADVKAKWATIGDNVGGSLAPIASLLAGGEVVAVARISLVIVFPSASMCNKIMDPDTYKKACDVVNVTYGQHYDFLALPIDVWTEKKIEYHKKYSVGDKYPSLSPFNDPLLRIIKKTKTPTITERQKTIEKMSDFFGEDED